MPRQINSIIRASKILRCISRDVCGITAIAKELQLSKGSVHGILETLRSVGFAAQDPSTRQYCLGPIFHEVLKDPLIAHKGLISCSVAEMEYLRDLSGETVALQIPNGSERIILEEAPSRHPIRYMGGKGASAPIYTGAGKVLLSELDKGDLDLFLNSIELVVVTPTTITDKKKLLRELEKTRKQGYTTSFGERLPGSACIAVPLKGYSCPVTLSIIGPEDRFSRQKMLAILPAMKQCSANISLRLKAIGRME